MNNADEQLKGGMFVSGRIIVGQRDGVVQVPRSTLLDWRMAKGTAKLLVVGGETVPWI